MCRERNLYNLKRTTRGLQNPVCRTSKQGYGSYCFSISRPGQDSLLEVARRGDLKQGGGQAEYCSSDSVW